MNPAVSADIKRMEGEKKKAQGARPKEKGERIKDRRCEGGKV
jgi:hypothetical protein